MNSIDSMKLIVKKCSLRFILFFVFRAIQWKKKNVYVFFFNYEKNACVF